MTCNKWHLCQTTLVLFVFTYRITESFLYITTCHIVYLPGRDMIWSPRNKRPERLRDSIKEVEVCLVISLCHHFEEIFLFMLATHLSGTLVLLKVMAIMIMNLRISLFTFSTHTHLLFWKWDKDDSLLLEYPPYVWAELDTGRGLYTGTGIPIDLHTPGARGEIAGAFPKNKTPSLQCLLRHVTFRSKTVCLT